jgi:hypothetical protein
MRSDKYRWRHPLQPDSLDRIECIHRWHLDVQQHQVGRVRGNQLGSFPAVPGHPNLSDVLVGCQKEPQVTARMLLIIRYQDFHVALLSEFSV